MSIKVKTRELHEIDVNMLHSPTVQVSVKDGAAELLFIVEGWEESVRIRVGRRHLERLLERIPTILKDVEWK